MILVIMVVLNSYCAHLKQIFIIINCINYNYGLAQNIPICYIVTNFVIVTKFVKKNIKNKYVVIFW